MHPNTARLRKVMAERALKAKDVATITNRSVTTVSIWRCTDERRLIPAELLRLVELSTKSRKVRK